MEHLLEHQIEHVKHIIHILTTHGRCIDLSPTGSGKTITAIVCCIILGLTPFIISTKLSIIDWVKVLNQLNCDFYGIVNYESFQKGKYYDKNNKKINCDFIDIIKTKKTTTQYTIDENNNINKEIIDDDNYTELVTFFVNNNVNNYKNIVFIFDECQHCKNIKSNNSQILKSLSEHNGIKILLLSASLADVKNHILLFGLVLKLYKTLEEGKTFLMEQHKRRKNENILLTFRDLIFPNYASQMNISLLHKIISNNNTIKNEITAKIYKSKNSSLIDEQYKIINNVNTCDKKSLGIRMKARENIELLTVPILVDETHKKLKEHKSVIIFVNFIKTMELLKTELCCNCFISGTIDNEQKLININNFNSGKDKLIICMIQCGSESINLHDTDGKFPRTTFILPTWNVQQLFQALGRTYRINVKSNTEQIIVLDDSENSKYIYNIIKDKINSLGLLNEGLKNEPIFQIDNLVEKYEDKEFVYRALHISKNEKQKLKEKQYLDDVKLKNNIKKKEIPFKSMNYTEIIKIMKNLKYRKNILENSNECNKDELLKNINDEIEKNKLLIQKYFS